MLPSMLCVPIEFPGENVLPAPKLKTPTTVPIPFNVWLLDSVTPAVPTFSTAPVEPLSPTTSVLTPASDADALVNTTVPAPTTVFPVNVVVAPSVSEPVPPFTSVLNVPPFTVTAPELTFANPLNIPVRFKVPVPLSPFKLLAPVLLTRPTTPLNVSGVVSFSGALNVSTPPPNDNDPPPSADAALTFKLPLLKFTPPVSVFIPVNDTATPDVIINEPVPVRLLDITILEPAPPLISNAAEDATFTPPLPSAPLPDITSVPPPIVVPPL
jgi:hypothetical protein